MPASIDEIIASVNSIFDEINHSSPDSAKITTCCSCSPMFDLKQPFNIRKSVLEYISGFAAKHHSPDVVLVELAAGQLLQSALNLAIFLEYLPAVDQLNSFTIVLSDIYEFNEVLKRNWIRFTEILNLKYSIEIQTIFFKGSFEHTEPNITLENASKSLSDDDIKKRVASGKEIVAVSAGHLMKIFYDMGDGPKQAVSDVKDDRGESEDELDDSHLLKNNEIQVGVLEVKTVDLPINEQGKREAILALVQRSEYNNYSNVRFHSLFNELSKNSRNVTLVTLIDLDLDYSFFTGLNPQRLAQSLEKSKLCGTNGVFLYADKVRDPNKIGKKPMRAEIIEFQVSPLAVSRRIAEFAEQDGECQLVSSRGGPPGASIK